MLGILIDHGRQVYHRDMKPSSLLLTTKLPDAVIKVGGLSLDLAVGSR